jgi:hypothetical protein
MAVIEYLYELRRGEELVATGRLTRDSRFQVGDRVEIVGQPGIVKTTEPLLGQHEHRLVIQLLRDPDLP